MGQVILYCTTAHSILDQVILHYHYSIVYETSTAQFLPIRSYNDIQYVKHKSPCKKDPNTLPQYLN
jgi:hypothetical protein